MAVDSGGTVGSLLQASVVAENLFRISSGVHRNFIPGGGGSTNSVEDRENGDLEDGSPLVRGSGGSCNLVKEISIHIVTFSQFMIL